MAEMESASNTDEEFIRFFARHLVPVFFQLSDGFESRSKIITSFALSVLDQWFLVTAGHCLQDIDQATTLGGYRITGCCLIDCMGLGAQHFEPIPFDYQNSFRANLGDAISLDYGIIHLRSHYRRLLEKNEVKALTEEVWKAQPREVSFYGLLGIPEELNNVDLESAYLTATLLIVRSVEERPTGFSETDTPLFYGKILSERPMSIKGMSGGPILAFHRDETGNLRYWLTALQSRWLPESRYIAGCLTRLLGDFLESMLQSILEEGTSETAPDGTVHG